LRQVQPSGWLDGLDSAGFVGGFVVGRAVNPGDRIEQIALLWGDVGTEYNFGELLPGSLTGLVHTDLNRDCLLQENEQRLAGIRIDLLNSAGALVATTTTDAQGTFQFRDLRPGAYTLFEHQPADYFDGGQRAGYVSGSGDGSAATAPSTPRGNVDQLNQIRDMRHRYRFGRRPGRLCVL
jgi:hypothetical protein